MFRSLRKGLATNSSSSHSVVIHSDFDYTKKHSGQNILELDEFENHFVLKTAKDKLIFMLQKDPSYYAILCNMNTKLTKKIRDVISGYGIDESLEELVESASQVEFLDVASTSGDIPFEIINNDSDPKKVTVADWLNMIMSPEVTIYGYYDNYDTFPYSAVVDDIGKVELSRLGDSASPLRFKKANYK